MSGMEMLEGFFLGQRMKYITGAHAPPEAGGAGLGMGRDFRLGVAFGFASRGLPHRSGGVATTDFWGWAGPAMPDAFRNAETYALYLTRTGAQGRAADSGTETEYALDGMGVDQTFPLTYEDGQGRENFTTTGGGEGGSFTAVMTANKDLEPAHQWPFTWPYRQECAVLRSGEIAVPPGKYYTRPVGVVTWRTTQPAGTYFAFEYAYSYVYDLTDGRTNIGGCYWNNWTGRVSTSTPGALAKPGKVCATVQIGSYVGTGGRAAGSEETMSGEIRLLRAGRYIEAKRAGMVIRPLVSSTKQPGRAYLQVIDDQWLFDHGYGYYALDPTKALDPDTGELEPITSWSYSYDTRTYTVFYTSGGQASISFGETQVTVRRYYGATKTPLVLYYADVR